MTKNEQNHNPLTYFINRRDAWGQYDESGKGFTAKGQLTEDILDAHVRGEITIGLHSTNNETNTSKWGALDFDDENACDNEEAKKQQFNHASVCYDILLTKFNVKGWIEDSGRKGYHVVFKCKETDATFVYNLLVEVRSIAESMFGHNVGGENYPKQPWISVDSYGNWIKMPLGLHPKTKRRMLVVDPKDGSPFSIEESIKTIENAPVNTIPEIGERVIGSEHSEVMKRCERKEEITAKCILSLIDKGMSSGNRHYSMMVITHYLWQRGWGLEDIKKALLEFNSNSKPPKPIDEIYREAEFQWRRCERGHAYFIGCKSSGIISQILNKVCPFKRKGRCPVFMEKLEERAAEYEKTADIKRLIIYYSDKIHLAQQMWDIRPYFYDRARLWWMWNFNISCWEIIDEVDIMNMVDDALENRGGSTESSFKNEVLEAMKRYGRRKTPKKIKNTWVQIGKKIIDVETGDEIVPTPEIFVTNSIPWNMGEREDTPKMDEIFTQWVGKKYLPTLYEIIAYVVLPDYPIHRIFCLNGGGCNGKSRYLALIKKFIGASNICSSSLFLLSSNRFEKAGLFKKLLCLIGETPSGMLSNTDMLKRLSGQDEINFEFKGKDSFTDINYAKIVIATNSLPATNDKTVGFYRRWMIIDFPNTFNEGKDILAEIPDEEYNNLARKVVRILGELLKRGEFTNNETIAERTKRYEEVSNPVSKFISLFCKKDLDASIPYGEFRDKFEAYMTTTHKRKLTVREIGKLLDIDGYERVRKKVKSPDDSFTTKIFLEGIEWSLSVSSSPRAVASFFDEEANEIKEDLDVSDDS